MVLLLAFAACGPHHTATSPPTPGQTSHRSVAQSPCPTLPPGDADAEAYRRHAQYASHGVCIGILHSGREGLPWSSP